MPSYPEPFKADIYCGGCCFCFKQNVYLVITKQVDTLLMPSPDPLDCVLPLAGMLIFIQPPLKKICLL